MVAQSFCSAESMLVANAKWDILLVPVLCLLFIYVKDYSTSPSMITSFLVSS